MHIEITYADGSSEDVGVRLEGERVLTGQGWVPGHVVEQPARCYFRADFFQMAIDEAKVRSGTEEPEEGESFDSFTWRVVGTDEEECRAKLMAWLRAIGPSFDPVGMIELTDVPATIAEGYRLDRQCWMTYLADPASELLMARAAVSPSPM